MVEADVFSDGHDALRCLLLHREAGSETWQEVPLRNLGNDRWQGSFNAGAIGRHQYTLLAWVDRFLTWRHDLTRREDEQDIAIALRVGADLIEAAARRATGEAAAQLSRSVAGLRKPASLAEGRTAGLDDTLVQLMAEHGERHFPTRYARVLEVVVDTARALRCLV